MSLPGVTFSRLLAVLCGLQLVVFAATAHAQEPASGPASAEQESAASSQTVQDATRPAIEPASGASEPVNVDAAPSPSNGDVASTPATESSSGDPVSTSGDPVSASQPSADAAPSEDAGASEPTGASPVDATPRAPDHSSGPGPLEPSPSGSDLPGESAPAAPPAPNDPWATPAPSHTTPTFEVTSPPATELYEEPAGAESQPQVDEPSQVSTGQADTAAVTTTPAPVAPMPPLALIPAELGSTGPVTVPTGPVTVPTGAVRSTRRQPSEGQAARSAAPVVASSTQRRGPVATQVTLGDPAPRPLGFERVTPRSPSTSDRTGAAERLANEAAARLVDSAPAAATMAALAASMAQPSASGNTAAATFLQVAAELELLLAADPQRLVALAPMLEALNHRLDGGPLDAAAMSALSPLLAELARQLNPLTDAAVALPVLSAISYPLAALAPQAPVTSPLRLLSSAPARPHGTEQRARRHERPEPAHRESPRPDPLPVHSAPSAASALSTASASAFAVLLMLMGFVASQIRLSLGSGPSCRSPLVPFISLLERPG